LPRNVRLIKFEVRVTAYYIGKMKSVFNTVLIVSRDIFLSQLWKTAKGSNCCHKQLYDRWSL